MKGRREGGGNKGVSARFRYVLGLTWIDPEAITSTLEYRRMMWVWFELSKIHIIT